LCLGVSVLVILYLTCLVIIFLCTNFLIVYRNAKTCP